MDSQKLSLIKQKAFRGLLWIVKKSALAATLGVVIWAGFHYASFIASHGKFITHSMIHRSGVLHIVETYEEAWKSVQSKVDSLRRATEDNKKLRFENMQLKLQLQTQEFEKGTKVTGKTTEDYKTQLQEQTGTSLGRVPASLNYVLPKGLHPSQLYTLGMAYFENHENEKAAAVFSSLLEPGQPPSFKTSKNYVTAGVAWYRLENYLLADAYFNHALRLPESEASIEFQAQARLWKALVAKKLNKRVKEQYWLRELLDHHPHSEEAKWVNRSEASREAASEE